MTKKTFKKMFDEKINSQEIYKNILKKSRIPTNSYPKLAISLTTICIAVLIIYVPIIFILKEKQREQRMDEININHIENETISTFKTATASQIYKFFYKEEIGPNTSSSSYSQIIQNRGCSDKAGENIVPSINLNIPKDLVFQASTQKQDTTFDCIEPPYFTEMIYENKEENRSVKIIYSKNDLTDPVINELSQNKSIKTSKINETSIQIFQDTTVFLAYFKYQENNFIMVSNNLKEEEFLNILSSLLQN